MIAFGGSALCVIEDDFGESDQASGVRERNGIRCLCSSFPLAFWTLETKMSEISSLSGKDKSNMMGDTLSLPLGKECGEGEDNATISATNGILFPLWLVCYSSRRHCNFSVQNEPEFSSLVDSRLETVLILFGETYNEMQKEGTRGHEAYLIFK